MDDDGGITSGEEAVAFLSNQAVYPARDGLASEVDMVMKGGITSGVVYPLAVCELARTHRFHSLGGSSAGGIAAAMAAAAELGRDSGGFKRLAQLPVQLGTDLLAIFQPSGETKPLFGVLLANLDTSRLRWPKLVVAVVRGGIRWFFLAFVTVLALAFLGLLLAGLDLGDLVALLPVLVPALALGVVAAAAELVLTGRRRLQANGYGLCRGSDGGPLRPPTHVEPFTDWLHARLQWMAGLGADDVLTFGHLWGDPGLDELPDHPAIRLEMMTTNVTHCRPVRLPFESDLYYYCPVELAEYFPGAVSEHVDRHSRPSRSGDVWTCPDHHVELAHLPHPGKMPVIVAVRMTLSFPVLISAVPLFAIDRAADPQRPVRCWFSDGGISSNFPIHFFDALWPRHPTFGISLGPYPPGSDRDVYLRDPTRTAQPRARDTSSFLGFAGAILDTLQNWSDEGQSTLPGYRDRIVEVRHTEREGGINLNMGREQIMSMCFRGYKAAKALDGFNFDHHRWVRYRMAMAELDKATGNMESKYDDDLPAGGPGYREFVLDLPEGSGDDPGKAWRNDAVVRTDGLLAFAGRQANGRRVPMKPDFPKEEPGPAPDLRIVAHF